MIMGDNKTGRTTYIQLPANCLPIASPPRIMGVNNNVEIPDRMVCWRPELGGLRALNVPYTRPQRAKDLLRYRRERSTVKDLLEERFTTFERHTWFSTNITHPLRIPKILHIELGRSSGINSWSQFTKWPVAETFIPRNIISACSVISIHAIFSSLASTTGEK